MNSFSKYLESNKEVLNKLLTKLLNKYPYVSILGTDTSGKEIRVNNRSISISPSSSSECGFVIKIYDGKRYFEYATSQVQESKIDNIVSTIEQLVSFSPQTAIADINAIEEELLTADYRRPVVGKNYNCEEIVNELKQLVETSIKKEKVVLASFSTSIMHVSKIFLSAKKQLTQSYSWYNVGSYILAREGEVTKYAYDSIDGNNLEALFAEAKPMMEETATLAVKLLKATLPKPGVYDVITDPSITGLIAHEAFGHGVEMDMFVKNRAQAKEYIDKYVASPIVTMHDGANAVVSVASYFFDDDGVSASDTTIIENGVLKRGISDVLSAIQLKTKPTGNGRRESYKSKSYTRMTNTFFQKGESTLDEMIKSIEDGYYICQTNNGMEDPKNWGIQCSALYGQQIKNGKLTDNFISPVVMSGHVVDLLKSVSMVSSDFMISGSGHCGKGHKEWVRVSDGGPCLKVRVKIG